MHLNEYLSIPYRLEAQTIETPQGGARVRLCYPELDDCAAEGIVLEDVLAELERRRMASIVAMVERGVSPPIPRPPLVDCDPLWIANDIGAAPHIIAALKKA